MASSNATTVEQYLAELPDARRAVVSAVRALVNRSLPTGYEEAMSHGMIGWAIPLVRYPKTYNKEPLLYAALAAQKHHIALYLMCDYVDPGVHARLADAFARVGKKLDMGKSCLRFKQLDDLVLDAVAESIASHTPAQYIAVYEASRAR